MKRVIVTVINDLASDQRVNRTCSLLVEEGFSVLLVGRKLKHSPKVERPYAIHRFSLLFSKGPLFYVEYTIRLFFFLLSHRFDLLFSNDLDTLLPAFLASKLKRKKILYDSHEYFTETPELVNRKNVQLVWRKIEQFILPKLPLMVTVNDAIANLFRNDYGINVFTVRNVPFFNTSAPTYSKAELNIPTDEKLIILQGAGINIQRGSEELVAAMKNVANATLLIVGGGDVIDQLKSYVIDEKLTEKVRFYSRQPFEKLRCFTHYAEIGFSLDKDTNLNYRFSLPNKLFDYMQSGTAVIASDLPEVRNIVEKYTIGVVLKEHNINEIANTINQLLDNEALLKQYQQNALFAAQECCWENEKNTLLKALTLTMS